MKSLTFDIFEMKYRRIYYISIDKEGGKKVENYCAEYYLRNTKSEISRVFEKLKPPLFAISVFFCCTIDLYAYILLYTWSNGNPR